MAQQTENAPIDRLGVLVGEWAMAAEFKDVPPADMGARVTFEWLADPSSSRAATNMSTSSAG